MNDLLKAILESADVLVRDRNIENIDRRFGFRGFDFILSIKLAKEEDNERWKKMDDLPKYEGSSDNDNKA